jgi:mycothiol synthase
LLKIRPFRKGVDEEIYVSIYNSAFSDYDDLRSVTLQEVQALEKAPSYNLDGLLIAEWDGQTAGMVQALVDEFREEKKGFIQSLAVLPEFRNRGIATKLLLKAVESLKNRRMEVAGAWAQANRVACVHLYESLGFKRVRTLSLMKRSLTEKTGIEVNEAVVVREAELRVDEDVALIWRLENEAFREHFNYRPLALEETKYMLFEMPWYRHQKAWFAAFAGEPVGYVIAGIDVRLNEEKHTNYGWILDIGVLKPFRRRKIGSTLMHSAMRYLRSLGIEDALLYVDDQNPTEAIKLYKRVGFEVFHSNAVYELQLVSDVLFGNKAEG